MGLATTSLSEESRGSAQKMHDPPDVASTSGGSGDFCGGNGADDALQDEVLFELLEGNRKYVRWLRDHRQSGDGGGDAEARGDGMCDYLQQIEEDKIGKNRAPLRPVQPKALVISCSRSFSPMDHVFSADARALISIRVCGYTCTGADSVIGSVEFALAEQAPPVLMVVGNARNDVVAAAVAMVRPPLSSGPCRCRTPTLGVVCATGVAAQAVRLADAEAG